MKANELRELTVEKLQEKLFQLKSDAVNVKFQHATAQLENTESIKNVRRDIARIHTVLNEKRSGKTNG
jgi:large subunit ribosomal protein L29